MLKFFLLCSLLLNLLSPPSQHRQLDLLLMGFVERGEFAGVLVDEALLDEEGDTGWVCTPHARKLFTLCDRMVDYLHEATVSS